MMCHHDCHLSVKVQVLKQNEQTLNVKVVQVGVTVTVGFPTGLGQAAQPKKASNLKDPPVPKVQVDYHDGPNGSGRVGGAEDVSQEGCAEAGQEVH